MSDEPTPDLQDTPAPESAPDTGHAPTDEQIINWEQRYNDLRPKFDQTAQEAAQYRQLVEQLTDPDTQGQALAALGLEIEDEDTGEYEDPTGELQSRLAQLEAQLSERTQAEQQAAEQEALADYVESEIGRIEKDLGDQFDEKEINFIVSRAANTPDHNGYPDVAAAVNDLQEVYKQQQQKWMQSKRADRIPGGQSAKQAIDLNNEAERAAYIDQQLGDSELIM